MPGEQQQQIFLISSKKNPMAPKSAKEVSEVLFSRISEVAIENHHLKRTQAYVRRKAQEGLRTASKDGATKWREALDAIVEVTK